jgi:hypothetical protein
MSVLAVLMRGGRVLLRLVVVPMLVFMGGLDVVMQRRSVVHRRGQMVLRGRVLFCRHD